MTTPVGLLQYFIVEASEYIEQLDRQLATAGGRGPNAEEMAKLARMLRGSATMSRLGTLADLAGGLERMARGVRDGALRWEPAVSAVFVAAIDDLKILVRGVRAWGEPEEKRARTRIAEIARWAPAATRTGATPPAAAGSAAYLSFETGEIAGAIEVLLSRPADRVALGNVIGRVRALRGIAALKDLPPLGDVVEGIERAAKPLELSGGAPDAAQISLFSAAAALLRRAAAEIRTAGRPEVGSAEVQRFAAAAAALEEGRADADAIVPIAALFYDDGGPHVVSSAPNPPTTPMERFRMEAVSHAEHLRRLVAEARVARDVATRERLARELRAALRALHGAAESFGEADVASFVDRTADGAESLEPGALAALDEMAALLAGGSARPGELAGRLATLGRGNARRSTPTGRELHAMLETGIEGISRLAQRPLSQPVPIIDETLVPIETLLYRGRAALDRAIAIRDGLRGQPAPDRESLEELFDLLDLAAQD
jgi:chemotaxis protein histidine kinase CheA